MSHDGTSPQNCSLGFTNLDLFPVGGAPKINYTYDNPANTLPSATASVAGKFNPCAYLPTNYGVPNYNNFNLFRYKAPPTAACGTYSYPGN